MRKGIEVEVNAADRARLETKRGLGAGAVAPPASSTELTGVVESFETPAIPPPLVA